MGGEVVRAERVVGPQGLGLGTEGELRETKAGVVQNARTPAGLQCGAVYFLAITIWVAAVNLRFTSCQLMLRMKASTYAFRSLP